jgi:hypothetical protein
MRTLLAVLLVASASLAHADCPTALRPGAATGENDFVHCQKGRFPEAGWVVASRRGNRLAVHVIDGKTRLPLRTLLDSEIVRPETITVEKLEVKDLDGDGRAEIRLDWNERMGSAELAHHELWEGTGPARILVADVEKN